MTEVEAVHDGTTIDGYPIDGDTLTYHWSPTTRRDLILERGLRIRQASVHAPIRYPMICLTLDPLTAWRMSAGTFITDEPSWDLWAVYAGDLTHRFEVIPTDDLHVRELRVYRSIPARHVHYVGTRDLPPDTLTKNRSY